MEAAPVCPICTNPQLSPFLRCTDHSVSGEEFRILLCDNCDLGITTPRPTSLEKYYASENYISHSASKKGIINKLYLIARKYTLAKKLKLVNQFSKQPGKLLDYGCGTGDFLDHCKTTWIVSGVEPSDKARAIAQSKSIEVSPTLQPNEYFDAITLWHVLEHIPDLDDALTKLAQHLNSNGTIFIAVPNMKSHDAAYYKNTWAGYDVPRHLWHFSPSAMKKVLQKHSLKLVKTIPMNLDAYYVSMLSEKYNGRGQLQSLFAGGLRGLVSNIHAAKTGNYSSLIYISTK